MHHLEEDTFHQRVDWQLWRSIFRHSLPYRTDLIILAIAGMLVAICDASYAMVVRWAVDSVMAAGAPISVVPYISAYMGLTAVLVACVFGFIYLAGGLARKVSHDIRLATFERLQELEFAYFDHRPSGWLISRLTSDCDKLARVLAWTFLDLIWATMMMVAIGTFLLILDVKLGLIVLSVMPPLAWISSEFQKRMLLSSRESRKANSLITAAFSEGLQGMLTTKTFSRESENLNEFSGLTDQMYFYSVRNALQSALYLPLVLLLGSVAGGLALWIGGIEAMAGTLTLGTLMAFIFYSGQLFEPINQMALGMVQLQAAQAAGERVINLLETEPQIFDSDAVLARVANGPYSEGLAEDGYPVDIHTIEFRKVGFYYKKEQPVLQSFDLTVKAGQTIALVGQSGGGKSTLVNLLSRFYEPTEGGIYLDGIEYRERSLNWFQSQLGIVLQSPHLLSESVMENIRYGRLEATDAEVMEAARKVNADGFIRELENGYATNVGEGGNRLSTGQKQLISFARALLADPQIFIMDEATSSIDTEAEALIQAGLAEMLAGRISFVIAHRLSTIRSADRILVIEAGQIRESGTHAELLQAGGVYADLYQRQFSEELVRAAGVS
jgi:ATP-binding cassette subfamily B protein